MPAIFQGPPGRGSLFVTLYSSDGASLLVAGDFVALAAVNDFSDAFLVASEKQISGSGTGVYVWDPETDVAIGDGTYPFRAYDSSVTPEPDDAPAAAGYLQWADHSQTFGSSGSGGGGGSADWTVDEKRQIRQALGITGDKSATNAGDVRSILAKVSTAQLRTMSPILHDGTVQLVQGDDYSSDDNTAVPFQLSFADVTDCDVFLRLTRMRCGSTATFLIEGEIDSSGEQPVALFDMDAAETALLPVHKDDGPLEWIYKAWLRTPTGKVHTFAQGAATVFPSLS